MVYILVTDTGNVFPYSPTDLIRSKPNTSWPNGPLSEETLASYGVYPVTPSTTEPTFDPLVEHVERTTPMYAGGKWVHDWVVVSLPFDIAVAAVRSQRKDLLVQSDWTQVADAPVDKAAWATYRQALRDIPTQSGFPWSVVWPVQPQQS